MADENNNLPIRVDGNEQAIIGTDVYVYGGQTAHAQVMKVAWGNEFTVNRATLEQPLPVQVYGITGSLATVTVTGSVRGLGTFNIGNTSGSAIHVTGGVNSFVYGVAGATPVAVTGSVSISSLVGITGTVNTTGGRFLSSSTDSIMVSGTLAKSWNLTNANDNITVYGFGGATFLSSKIAGSDGTIIGNSGGALNVNVVGAGISATVNVAAVIGVQNATGGVLRIEGTAGGTPVPVSISAITPQVTVFNNSENPFFVDMMRSLVSYTGSYPDPTLNNLEKMFVTKQPGTNTLISTAQMLNGINSVCGNYGGNNTIYKRLENIEQGTSTLRTHNNTNSSIRTKRVELNSTSAVLLDPSAAISSGINHGVTIKNIGTTVVTLGAAVLSGTSYVAPTNQNDFGIVLLLNESIFIPAKIYVPGSFVNPPLYGRVDFSSTGTTGAVAIMAV